MKKQTMMISALSLSVALLAGCAKDPASSNLTMTISNVATVAKVTNNVNAAPAAPVTFTDGVTEFTITEARMHIRDIRFDTSDTANVGERYTITGPYVMNLMDGTAQPSNIVFDAPAGEYKRVDIRLDEANVEDAPLAAGDVLLGNALVIKGTHDYGTPGTNAGTFSLTVKVSEDIRFEPVTGIVVGTDTGANINLVYNVTDWLEDPDVALAGSGAKIDVSACIAANPGVLDAGTGHITLDEGTQCAEGSFGNIIKDNMKNKYDFSS